MSITPCSKQTAMISEDWRVVDVGGGANPLPRADFVIDGLNYEDRGALRRYSVEDRVTKERWITLDLCERRPWPFPDKYFDYANCTHVLEDVRDPLWVCSEICRISKAGFISTPSRIVEQAKGVEHPCYAGYCHHRWLASIEGGQLAFRFKPHSLHSVPGAIVTRVGANEMINPKYAALSFEWLDSFIATEVLCFDEAAMIRELCDFVSAYKKFRDVKVRVHRPVGVALRRWVYFLRMKWGDRV